jgi:hypothetical protein
MQANPVAPVRRAVSAALDELAATLRGVSTALATDDPDRAEQALRRARSTQPLIDRMHDAIRAAKEITAVAPAHWSRRRRLPGYIVLANRVDYALRNARGLARRAHVARRFRFSPRPEVSPPG